MFIIEVLVLVSEVLVFVAIVLILTSELLDISEVFMLDFGVAPDSKISAVVNTVLTLLSELLVLMPELVVLAVDSEKVDPDNTDVSALVAEAPLDADEDVVIPEDDESILVAIGGVSAVSV